MNDVLDILQQALVTKEFDTVADAMDYVLKKNDTYVDFKTFVKLTKLVQVQIDHECNIKFFV